MIYPTAPFITAGKLRDGMKLLKEMDADSVLPVVRFSFPPQRAFYVRDGKLGFFHEEYKNCRSQDLEPYYHDCGQYCCFKTETFLEKGSLVTEKTYAQVFPESEVQDIDTLEDWKIAEIKYAMMKEKNS